MPGRYGSGSQQYTAGEGRLARPKFRFSGDVSVGYDDNVFQTPTHGWGTPEQKVQVLVTPGTPETTVAAPASTDPLAADQTQTPAVVIPATKPKFRTQTIPGVPAPKRIASFITRADVTFDTQFASRRTLFTFDLKGGVDYYWDRPGKKEEYTGSVALVYLRRLSGRAQFTATLDASYQTQPNFSQPNTPTTNNRGSYLTADAKADLSYRLTPRFSTVTSVSYNALYSMEQTQRSTDYGETTFGTELRYLFSPRLTLLGELRYSSIGYQESSARDSTSYILLAGGELTLSRRFMASVRLGETLRTLSETEQATSSPSGEATLSYRVGRGTTAQLNARYGFEEGQQTSGDVVTFRTGILITQVFSPRLQANLGLNLVRTTTTTTSTRGANTGGNNSTSSTATTASSTSTSGSKTSKSSSNASTSGSSTATSGGNSSTTGSKTSKSASNSSKSSNDSATGASSTSGSTNATASTPVKTETFTMEDVQDTIDATLSLQYKLSRHWSFSLSYSYTTSFAAQEINDYYRQRVFLTAEYAF